MGGFYFQDATVLFFREPYQLKRIATIIGLKGKHEKNKPFP